MTPIDPDPRSPAAAAVEPVRRLATDEPAAPTDGVALCLSGGGYRAMIFHVGVLWRLNQAGWLSRLDRISSVSGGSITAAALGQSWAQLEFDQASGIARAFDEHVTGPLRELAGHTIDEAAIAIGLLTPGTIGSHVADAYRKRLFATRTLQDLPDQPRFIFNATNLDSGVLWRFSKAYIADWRVGTIPTPRLELAEAVAASSAFPPVLSPYAIDLRHADWQTVEGNDLSGPEHRSTVVLTDGGVYDNLGLETAWKRCHTILVSDAGGQMSPDPHPPHDWARQSLRVLHVVDNQVRDLRKRQIQAGYQAKQREGAYWGIRSDITHYPRADHLPCPHEQTMALADIPTRLKALDDTQQQRLINWGYAVTDAALRAWVDPSLASGTFPYPQAGVG